MQGGAYYLGRSCHYLNAILLRSEKLESVSNFLASFPY